jgi:signal transduction histidine kinase
MLAEFISINRDEIIERCRAKVANRSMPPPSKAEIDRGVPLFLNQLIEALHSRHSPNAAIGELAGEHGHDLLLQGFSVSQVVHDYGDVCQTITELAVETEAPISADDFKTLNRCLDEAIAGAVTIYAGESQERASASQREATSRSNERVSFLVHELRNLVNTALVAFEVLKTGNVGVSGSTGAVLQRSLLGLRNLIAHSLDEVRMSKGTLNPRRIELPLFISDVAAAAALEASARGITFSVGPIPEELTIDADPQILAAVLGNLLQNAIKFTRPDTEVTLRLRTRDGRLLIEVGDECGGLPGMAAGQESPPPVDQRAADRTGLGVGLAFSRWGVESNGGRLYVRNVPDQGCTFVVDLPFIPSFTKVPA